ncbi:pyridoxal phosphate-dependent aminotransferase [Candidatus Roizmanbacteria bacterium]|nr:pyridoxal phosphate-dependent aminotransferase [Candidatus Roizmanbacteria bacterium]
MKLHNLTPSPTLALDAKVKALQSHGQSILNFSLGEPNFSTPTNICEAATRAIYEGLTHYTAVAGLPTLREAIVEKLWRENKVRYSPAEIIVSVGAKMVLYLAFQVLLNPGDEVLVPTPTWSTYIEQIKMAGGIPVFAPLRPPFKLRAVDLQKHITSHTKVILLNSPSNPTGAIIDEEELEKIGELAIKNNLIIISDEIYDKIVYRSMPLSIAALSPEIQSRTIIINGLSKAYAMTGWRVGYAAGPREIIDTMVALQGQTTSNTCSVAQAAAIEALCGTQESIMYMVQEFAERRNYLLDALKDLTFVPPEGAFYLFVSVEKYLNKKVPSSSQWCEALLEQERVAVVPGEAFLYPGYFRMSFAASMKDLKKGVQHITRFIHSL